MLARITLAPDDKVLDLGCGYGLVGAWAAGQIGPDRIWMVDNDRAAIACAERNLKLNGLSGAHLALGDGLSATHETAFTQIICHPPYHADFAVPKVFIEKGFNRLALGGRLWMVTRREPWYRNKLTAIFGGVKVTAEAGYFIFEAEKRRARYANAKPR
jgi:16S rRNA (guanine1207-N2)-methyltransferase